MKGIILAGGLGSRLFPMTNTVSKQMLPIYDKPLIHYPLSTLMLAGIREILIITRNKDQHLFKELLGDGSELGISLQFATQDKPRGIAEALIIAESFLKTDNCMLILGDNIFHGVGLGDKLSEFNSVVGAHIFTYEVSSPTEYGILQIDSNGTPIAIEEKPARPKSNLAVTGLYVFDDSATEIAKSVVPSPRGEIEITSVIESYLSTGTLGVTKLSRGTAWLDTGTPKALHDAATYVRIVEERTGLKIGCVEEIAFHKGWIDKNRLLGQINHFGNSDYGQYLRALIETV